MDPQTLELIKIGLTLLGPLVTALAKWLSGDTMPPGAQPLLSIGTTAGVAFAAGIDPVTSLAMGAAGVGVREVVDRGLKTAGLRPRH